MIIGVLSDTHGDLHPRLPELFREAGVGMILHAGDVGGYSIVSELERIAPVRGVRGNVDTYGPAAELPVEIRLVVERLSIYMTHIGGKPATWYPKLPEPKPGVAICGHSHAPLVQELDDVLFLNPGSAGTKRRFNLPLSAALLRVENGVAKTQILLLEDS